MKNRYSLEVWNDYYEKERKIHVKPKAGFFASYDIFLCDSILAKYLPFNKGNKEDVKVCEIGSGDGKLVRKIAESFNYEPFGIEYAPEAVEQSKKIGVKSILGDAFDKNLLEKYDEYFDVVYSYGFAEHIFPPEKAVEVHLKLLKKGGYFFVQIPRLKGFNYLKARLFRPDLIPLHNISLMEAEALELACMQKGVKKLLCENYGTFKLRIPLAKKNIRWYVLKAICALEYVLNPLCRMLFRDKGFETKTFSPAIMFIGKKL